MKETTFYNTIHLSKNEVKQEEKMTKKQERTVLNFLKKTKKPYPNYKLNEQLFNNRLSPASMSRALRELTKNGHLIKCSKDEMVVGKFGRKVHTWEINHYRYL